MKLLVNNISLPPDESDDAISALLMEKYGLYEKPEVRIIRKSLDARKKHGICFRYRVVLEADKALGEALLSHEDISLYEEEPYPAPVRISAKRSVVIIGAGPAGLFAALRLAASGAEVTLIERGKSMEQRAADVELLETDGIIDAESNAVFGEGGAGAFSDGKLTARTLRPESAFFFNEMIKCGAPSDIAFLARPHIGTDRLKNIIPNLIKSLTEAGVRILFSAKADGLILDKGACMGVSSGEEEFFCDAVIAAPGHSAEDTYNMLLRHGVAISRKDTAVGLRIEHPAELIRDIQYGTSEYKKLLPPAEYAAAFTNSKSKRGTYTFCMCPGGRVINASNEEGRLCLNGMSGFARDGEFSNAALVVTVGASDYGEGELAGLSFCHKIEEAAFKAGGGGFKAPAQRVTSFLSEVSSGWQAPGKAENLPASSYRRGLRSCSIGEYLPPFIVRELFSALQSFGKTMKGFITEEALLIGAETGTSAPVRILRGADFQSVSVKRLFPAGEGSGYAGGIVSSAVDGICTADAIIKALSG